MATTESKDKYQVYDGRLLWVFSIIPLVGLLPLIGSSKLSFDVIAVPIVISVLLNIAYNSWISFNASQHQVIASRRFLVFTILKRAYDFAEFQEIRIHRGARGNYMVTLTGGNHEVILCVANNVERPRKIAEVAARATGLELIDGI